MPGGRFKKHLRPILGLNFSCDTIFTMKLNLYYVSVFYNKFNFFVQKTFSSD
ncbi:hypothetical protein M2374_003021 [Citrobacter sp. JUb117]|nr:hypothetical protein [Citrobacter sp. JUb117]